MSRVTYKPCHPKHIFLIKPQEGDIKNKEYYMAPDFAELITNNIALSAWIGDKCIGAAGIIDIFPHKAIAWTLLGADAGPHMLELTRKIKNFFGMYDKGRIEMTVVSDFAPGHRWAKLLGFTCETPNGMKKNGVHGNDEHLYSRVT